MDKEEQQDAQENLLSKFYQKARENCPPTFKKVSFELQKFARANRDMWFEISTTNTVEQVHNVMRHVKNGDIVNFVNNLVAFQIHAINKLTAENSVETPTFTGYATYILSLQLALASAFKVEETSHGIYTVAFDGLKECPVLDLYQSYMVKLNRSSSYWNSRKPYLLSLQRCVADNVTEISCSLCPATKTYCYCPHVLAVRSHRYLNLLIRNQ